MKSSTQWKRFLPLFIGLPFILILILYCNNSNTWSQEKIMLPGVVLLVNKSRLLTNHSLNQLVLDVKTVSFKNETTTHHKSSPVRPNVVSVEDQSCDIQMALYYQKKQGNTSYPSLYNNFTAIGGSDWSFSATIGCLDRATAIFNKSSGEWLIPRCTDQEASLETTMNLDNVPVFDFPDKCLSRVIEKFCTDNLPVPNIVHYILFGGREFDFIYFVSFYSVFKFQKPCLIFLYFDAMPFGAWWNLLQTLVKNIVLVKLTPPTHISGKKIIFVQHKSDIMRLKILKEYGGIYLDTDQYILRSINEFRNRECTMEKGPQGGVANAVIFATKNATFINIWIDNYRNYSPNKWGQNSVQMARVLSLEYPQYIYVYEINCIFFPRETVLYHGNYKWSHNFAIHFFNKDFYYHSGRLRKLNLETIKSLNNTIGAVFRYILYGNKELCK